MNGQNKQVGEQKNCDTHKVSVSNEKPGSSISVYQGKTSNILKTMTNY